jgi:hypothetical protein
VFDVGGDIVALLNHGIRFRLSPIVSLYVGRFMSVALEV